VRTVAVTEDLGATLAAVPSAQGVGQILARGQRNLIVGRATNLRRWAATHLGGGPPPRRGARPRTDLRPLAAAIAFETTATAFGQRLVYERLMAGLVSPADRRDLKPAAFLRLDLRERFPRLVVLSGTPVDRAHVFGPFRDRRAAEQARDAIQRSFRLRPCDYVFEPDPALPLGVGCLFAQVRSCAAPCLGRVSENGYRELAARVATYLGEPPVRGPDAVVPPWVGTLDGVMGLVVDRGPHELELYPVSGGAVLDEGVSRLERGGSLAAALSRLTWLTVDRGRDDWAWLSAWLHAPRRRGGYLVVQDKRTPPALLEGVRALGLWDEEG
jgi:hypothetical protein